MTTVVYPSHERRVHLKIKKYRETSTSHDTFPKRNLLPSLFSIRCLSQRTSCRSFTSSTVSTVPKNFGCSRCSALTRHLAAVGFFCSHRNCIKSYSEEAPIPHPHKIDRSGYCTLYKVVRYMSDYPNRTPFSHEHRQDSIVHIYDNQSPNTLWQFYHSSSPSNPTKKNSLLADYSGWFRLHCKLLSYIFVSALSGCPHLYTKTVSTKI